MGQQIMSILKKIDTEKNPESPYKKDRKELQIQKQATKIIVEPASTTQTDRFDSFLVPKPRRRQNASEY